MNYRHIFHAGNICDITKHVVLALLIEHLRGKDKGFCVLDTHAGVGLYDLRDERAQKTKEAQNGILQFLQADFIPELADYYAVLQKLNSGWNPTASIDQFHFYPGSPLLAGHLLRPQDRLIACELHDEDIYELRRSLRDFLQAQTHHRDGYKALSAFLPPSEKRGLVLIDPPYENTGEFETLTNALIQSYKRWPQGIYMAWYPIKERPAIWRFHEALADSGIPKMLCAEFIFEEEVRHDRLNGSGLIIINPPWQMDKELGQVFPAIHKALQANYSGVSIKWLTAENEERDNG